MTVVEQTVIDVASALAKTFRKAIWQHQAGLAENEKRLCRAELALAIERGAVLCTTCKGEGWVAVLDPDDWYGHDKADKCAVCDGNGRTEGALT